MKIFSIFDSKAEAFHMPFFSPTKGTAIRSFAQAANDESSDFFKHAGDYTLFEIGDWEELQGDGKFYEAKINLGTALEHQTQQQLRGELKQMLSEPASIIGGE